MRITDQQAEAVVALLDSFCDFIPSCTSLPLEAVQKTRAAGIGSHPDQEHVLNAHVDVKSGGKNDTNSTAPIGTEDRPTTEWMDITLRVLIQPELRPILVWRRMLKEARENGEELPRPRTPMSSP